MASVTGGTEPPADGPATGAPGADVPGTGPAVVPPVELGADVGDSGAAAACGTGLEPSPLPVDDVLTEELAAGGAVVVVTSGFTTGDAPVCAGGTVVVVGAGVLTVWSVASDGFELPPPVEGTVVLTAGATVVAGAAVAGGVVVAGALLAAVPWVPVEVPAGSEAGEAVSAAAGPAFRTRNIPARSAKAAAHLRGFTASGLALVLMG
ncbi:MAG: hypothetical protein M3203_00475 [Actinomycetota bacterium]|nr:hypothetical protein [Actinomycetota bacterium]